MSIIRIMVVATAVMASACGGKRIKPDGGMSAIQSNYPTAEFYACGAHFMGIGQCEIERGEDVSALGLRIQTYHKGSVLLFSEVLGADVSIGYEGNMRLDPELYGRPDSSFVLGIVITPEYPGESDEPIAIHGAIGFLNVNVVRPGEDWSYRTTRAKENIGGHIDLDVADMDLLIVKSSVCGIDEEIDVSTVSEYRLALSDLTDVSFMRRCPVNISLVGGEVRYLSWMAWVYLKEFNALPIPETTIKDGKLKVVADGNVSVVALDDKWEISNEAEFDFDMSQVHYVRAMTVKGRLCVGAWMPGGRDFIWMR